MKQLDDLMEAFVNAPSNPTVLLDIQREIIGVRYRIAEMMGSAKKDTMQAENFRKGKLALVKLSKKDRGASMAQATEEAERDPEIIQARGQEVMAEAYMESLRRKYEVSGEAVQAISMRVSYLKQELRESRATQHT